MTTAIILAGGQGLRFGQDLPKQFSKLAGRMVIEHTVSVFEHSSHIQDIIIVIRPEYEQLMWEITHNNAWKKVSRIVHGGDDRFSSTYSALTALKDAAPNTKVLFHDAVRPLVTDTIIERSIKALDYFKAVDVVIPSSDTLVHIHDNGSIANIPNRATMRRGQTPQGFILETIKTAYQRAIELDQRVFTCDCSVIRAMLPHIEVTTVLGAEENIKITVPLDLFLAEKLIQTAAIDINTDEDQLAQLQGKTVVVFGGTSGIGEALVHLLKQVDARVFATGRSQGIDIANRQQVNEYLSSIAQQHEIFAVVNSAGILIKKPFATTSENDILNSVHTNYLGALNIASAAYPYLKKSQGMLLNFTSSSYTRGRAFYAIYSSTKCAVVNLTQALAEEWVNDGIKVNCINPERTATPMRTQSFGLEPADTLLSAETVARYSAATLVSKQTGIVVDVRRKNNG